MEHRCRGGRAGVGLGRPGVERKERDEGSKSEEQEEIDNRVVRNQAGLGELDDVAKVETAVAEGLEEVKPDQAEKENEAAGRKVNGGFPRGGLAVPGAPDADQQEGRDERELVEHVEKKHIHGGEGANDARRNHEKADVEPAVIFHRRTGHRNGGQCDGGGEEKHNEAETIRTEDEIDPELGNDRETGNKLEAGLGGAEFRGQHEQQDQIRGRCEERDGAGFSTQHHENGCDQRNEDEKK